MIDWNDKKKRKEFREALQRVYPKPADLRIFVSEELNENLVTIASDNNLQETAFDLISWAQAKGRLDEVFEAFCRENPKHPDIAGLQQRSLIKQASNLREEDWKTLFEQFSPYDFADIHRAFQRGFQRAWNVAFQQVRPDHPPLTEQAQIQELLATYDDPKLAVRFVESVIAEIQRTSEGSGRDLTGLEQWRDRIAQRFNVSAQVSEPRNTIARHAYLLIAIEANSDDDVNAYPELHITGRETPILFAAKKKDGPISEVVNWISEWIPQAEGALNNEICDYQEVILEVFLPHQYLEEDIATTWIVKDDEDDEDDEDDKIPLGKHRRVLVRSSDRIRNPKIRRMLEQTWERLKDCDKAQNACAQFHIQENCPEGKDMYGVLQDAEATGLKLLAKLPNDSRERTALLKGIIRAAIPIALWPSETADADVHILKTEFDALLAQIDLTNFADLAKQWRVRRRESASAKHIRLLCDRPDRFPNPPDPNREEDLFVAS